MSWQSMDVVGIFKYKWKVLMNECFHLPFIKLTLRKLIQQDLKCVILWYQPTTWNQIWIKYHRTVHLKSVATLSPTKKSLWKVDWLWSSAHWLHFCTAECHFRHATWSLSHLIYEAFHYFLYMLFLYVHWPLCHLLYFYFNLMIHLNAFLCMEGTSGTGDNAQ